MSSRSDLLNKAKELAGKTAQKANETGLEMRNKAYELGDALEAKETAAVKGDFLSAVFAAVNQNMSFFDSKFKTIRDFKKTMEATFVQGSEFTIKDLYIGVMFGSGYPGLSSLNKEIARIYERDIERTPDLTKVIIDTEKMKKLFGPNRQPNT